MNTQIQNKKRVKPHAQPQNWHEKMGRAVTVFSRAYPHRKICHHAKDESPPNRAATSS